MTTLAAPAPARRDLWRWAAVGGVLLLLLSIYSQGFFLYAALVVAALGLLESAIAAVALLGVTVERTLEHAEIELGAHLTARLRLANRKELPAWWLLWRDQVDAGLDVEGATSGFRSFGSGEERELVFRLHSLRRGLFRVGPVLVESSGPFGLVRRFRMDRQVQFVTVLPKTVALGGGWPLGHRPVHEVPRRRSLFEDPTRFLGVRDYRHGDELRRIHWRATARHQRLQVKVYEPAVLAGVLLAVEMSAAAYPGASGDEPLEEGDPRVELAVVTAAAIADFVLAGDQQAALLANGSDAAERFPGDWTGGSFRRLDEALAESGRRRKITAPRPLEVEAGKGGRQRDRLRAALARLCPAPGPSLPAMLDLELPRLPRSLVLAVVTPRVDAALASIAASLRRSGLEVAVVEIAGPEDDGETRDVGALPTGIPHYRVASEDDLIELGGRRL